MKEEIESLGSAKEPDQIDAKFENLTEIEIETFKNMLEENAISYTPMYSPCDKINDILYEATSHIYSCFKEFLDDLNSKAIEEIYLYSVRRHFEISTGECVYRIRFARNTDLIDTNCIRLITTALNSICSKTKSKGVTAERLKKHLQSFGISEETSKNMIKLIRIIHKLEF